MNYNSIPYRRIQVRDITNGLAIRRSVPGDGDSTAGGRSHRRLDAAPRYDDQDQHQEAVQLWSLPLTGRIGFFFIPKPKRVFK